MYFDFEDYRPDTPSLGSAISRREGILLSVIVHLVALLVMLLGPDLPWVRDLAEQMEAARRAALAQRLEERRSSPTTFVFVQPRLDVESPRPPDRGEASDKDRVARAPERSPDPTNPLPFARGNSPERVEAPNSARARGEGPTSDPPAGTPDRRGRGAADAGEGEIAQLPQIRTAPQARAAPGARGGNDGTSEVRGGALGEALRNLERYVREESFDNLQGDGGNYGSSIQFDTKGVEFGPWIRRFVAQIKRNWFVPLAAMSLRGRVVVTFYVHKDGSISELAVPGPSAVDAFNHSSFNALAASNPTQPLPPEYPADRAFFTVTFYYNETPPAQ